VFLRSSATFRRFLTLLSLSPLFATAQTPNVQPQPNTNAIYQQLKNAVIGQESIALNGARFKRDAGLFTFKNGTMYFISPVNGKVTGAVFVGEGSFVLEPSSEGEQHSIALLTKENAIQENFTTAVFRFTDNSYDELKKMGTTASTGRTANPGGALSNVEDTLRKGRVIRYNLAAHMLTDVLSEDPGDGMFYAFINGQKFTGKELFAVDPHGITMLGVEPEEVAFATYDESGANNVEQAYAPSIWYSGHLMSEVDAGKAKSTQFNATYDIESQKIDATIEKSAAMEATAITTFVAKRPGLRTVSFSLFRNFKIQTVTDESGQPLEYVFEEGSFSRSERDDADNFTVILPRALGVSEKYTIKTAYGGKEAVSNAGGGNYYPVARDDWFPANRLGDAANFEITFRIPKGMKIAATGSMISEATEGDHYVTRWRSDAPMWVAGFNFGRFKMMETKLPDGMIVRSYANEDQPDWVHSLQLATSNSHEVAMGTMETTSMMKRPLGEGQDAMQIYTNYFGPVPYKQLEISQQTACDYGQAWPGLVWLPICSFFDSTVRHQLGLDDVGEAYWDVVTPHEVAHQWWGHTVAWNSYRDQWMSEGFAEFSASLFAQAVYAKEPGKYLKFWADRQRNLQMKNQFGFRYSEVAPLNFGWRMNNKRSGFSTYRHVVYPKGAFVLHMLRMMMYDNRTGDAAFREMMHDFVKTYTNRAASTEDFKAIVEKHMIPVMDMEGNHKMDWFFNEWVYGTEIPKYTFSYDLRETPEGWLVNLKLSQEGVSANFLMPVPVYCELANGKIVRLGSINNKGQMTSENKIPLGKGPKPKRFMINYNYDVLTLQQ
jgi:hypothetical protein